MNNQFFIVGAQRSGTTYLYSILDEHPEVCMAKPLRPEPKYFLQNEIDLDTYYSKYYKNCTKATKIFGEKSTSYYENKEVAQKVANYFPNAKIIFILANPVDRAISNYKFSYINGLETRDIEEVFINEKKIDVTKYITSVNPFRYKERGVYHKFLDYYYKVFPQKNIKVIIKENFTGNLEEIQSLYTFLEIDNNIIPNSYTKVINKSKNTIEESILNRVKTKLFDYYKEHNIMLSTKYGLDLAVWDN